MFQLFIVKQRFASASHKVSENQKYVCTYSYDCLHNVRKYTHIVANAVLKEGYRMDHNLLSVEKKDNFVCEYVHM